VEGLEFHEASFGSDTEHSVAAITVANKSGKPLTLLSMFAELIDQNGRVIMTIPLVGGSVSLTTDGQTGLPIRNQWQEPIRARENVTMGNPVQYVTRECPARVRLIPVVVGFADGTQFSYPLKDVTLLPSVLTPHAFDLITLKRSLPFEARVRVEVDSSGKVLASSVDMSDADLGSWAAQQLGNWIFRPAMKDGLPVDSEVFLFLRVHKVPGRLIDIPESKVATQEQVEIPVDVYPKPGKPAENQLVSIGQFMYEFPQ
jgi:hypothetical protein